MSVIKAFGNIINGLFGENVVQGLKTVMTSNILANDLEKVAVGHKLNNDAASIITQAVGLASKEGSGIEEEMIKKMRTAATGKGMTATNFLFDDEGSRIIQDLSDTNETFGKAIDTFKKKYFKDGIMIPDDNQLLSNAEILTGSADGKISAFTRASGFFHDPTTIPGGSDTYGSLRTKAVLGGYAAGAVGTRFLSGGDLTHNSRGENDIAGIPFF